MIQDNSLDKAVKLLLEGDVVAFPTETVYGLGAVINNPAAINKIFSTKQRPFFDPLIVHVSSIEQAKTCFLEWPEIAHQLATHFWPGPLTLVMPKSEIISDVITSGLQNVGVRWSQHPLAQQLIEMVHCPVAAPSANKFGKTSPTQAQHVIKEFESQVYVLDSGPCEIGIESTVLMIKNFKQEAINPCYQLSILRKGAILKTQIDDFLKNICNQFHFHYEWLERVSKKESPGHMKHHYMPDIPFIVCRNPHLTLSQLATILNDRLQLLPDEVEGVKIVKPTSQITKIEFLKLSTQPFQAAREFYSQLRLASERRPQALCFIQMPAYTGEMWESLFDRMYKAASLIIDD